VPELEEAAVPPIPEVEAVMAPELRPVAHELADGDGA
jgi:hypothetical protein